MPLLISFYTLNHFVSFVKQLLSPLSDGLFHRGIAQSGTAAMDLLVTDNSVSIMQVIHVFFPYV